MLDRHSATLVEVICLLGEKFKSRQDVGNQVLHTTDFIIVERRRRWESDTGGLIIVLF